MRAAPAPPAPAAECAIGAGQLARLREVLATVLEGNLFYRGKLGAAGLSDAAEVSTASDYARLPFTTKEELSLDQAGHPPYGTNLTFGRDRYTRLHLTSGTTGERLRWLDTAESWDWWGRCWGEVYAGAGVRSSDRIFFAFSFGPFIGFWSACEGARRLGALIIPGGGMSSQQRVRAIAANQATVLVCTPTYALHLAEVAGGLGVGLSSGSVRTTIHAGEPGAGLPATRARIEAAWGARCFDHAGATEVGAWGFECGERSGMHLNEEEFIFEVLTPGGSEPATEGELVVTNLGRAGMPVIRYRTGDLVRLAGDGPCRCGRPGRRLQGGVIGRLDDALLIRGTNVYPSAIENVVRRFPQVTEFAVDVRRRSALDELEVRVELDAADPDRLESELAQALHGGLGLRAAVAAVPAGTLPRFELKARRVTDHRATDG
ncbi:MAG: phenylacetate--CoA ligase family protein [Gemmatimonadetes bacterium]|nr:phenylacetate--CoA ligase family protein [Gemmatimonadota bacterium]